MSKYRKRITVEIDAIKIAPQCANWKAVEAFDPRVKAIGNWNDVPGQHVIGFVIENARRQKATQGDWIVSSSDGTIESINDEAFCANYEEVPQP